MHKDESILINSIVKKIQDNICIFCDGDQFRAASESKSTYEYGFHSIIDENQCLSCKNIITISFDCTCNNFYGQCKKYVLQYFNFVTGKYILKYDKYEEWKCFLESYKNEIIINDLNSIILNHLLNFKILNKKIDVIKTFQ